MQNITSTIELKNAIQQLEVEQAIKGRELQEQFFITYENLKPTNLLKGTFSEIVSSPYIIENILAAATELATGYLSRKIGAGASSNIFRKFIEQILKFGVTNYVAQHPDAIKSIVQFVFQHVFRKRGHVSSRKNIDEN